MSAEIYFGKTAGKDPVFTRSLFNQGDGPRLVGVDELALERAVDDDEERYMEIGRLEELRQNVITARLAGRARLRRGWK